MGPWVASAYRSHRPLAKQPLARHNRTVVTRVILLLGISQISRAFGLRCNLNSIDRSGQTCSTCQKSQSLISLQTVRSKGRRATGLLTDVGLTPLLLLASFSASKICPEFSLASPPSRPPQKYKTPSRPSPRLLSLPPFHLSTQHCINTTDSHPIHPYPVFF